MKRIFYVIMAAALLAVSCQEKTVEPELTLNSPAEVTVAQAGDIVTVEFSTNVEWTASLSTKDWATLNSASGTAGVSTIKVTVLKNDSEDARSCDLTISAGTKSVKVKVNQLQKNAIYVETTEYEVSDAAQQLEVKVLSNADYTVEPMVDWIKFVSTKASIESTIVLDIEANKGEAREGSVLVKGAENIELTIKQKEFVPYFNLVGFDDYGYMYAPVTGGTVYFQVQTNVAFEMTTYDDTFTWQHVSVKEETENGFIYTVEIDPNTKGYDARESYVKFVSEEYQVPVLDEAGEPTGETEAFVARAYFLEDGNVQVPWMQDFTWDLYNESHRYSMAVAGDYLLVSTGLGVKAFSKAGGAFVGNLELPDGFVPTGITNDDAGNIVVSFGGDYPLLEDWSLDVENQKPLDVYVVSKENFASLMGGADVSSCFTHLFQYYDGFYGYGLDNIRVTGDATKDACVTMVSAGGSPGGSYAVCWEIKDGVCTSESSYTDYVTLLWTSEIWSSANLVARTIGTTCEGGIYAIGYDGNYNLHYNATMSSANWQEVFVTGSSWAEGYNAMDFIEWNGHKYAAILGMSYFGKCDWGYMPSYLFLLNIDDPAAPVLVSKQECYMNQDEAAGMFVYGSTTDVCLEVEGDNLAAYVFDSGISRYLKVVYPKL